MGPDRPPANRDLIRNGPIAGGEMAKKPKNKGEDGMTKKGTKKTR